VLARTLLTAVLLAFVLLPVCLRGQPGAAAPTASLQESIDQAAPGDTITVNGGTYHERIVIDKALSLVGVGSPVIDGDQQGDVVTITGENVTISGFEIRGSGIAVSKEPSAIRIENAHAPTVRSNVIKDSCMAFT
jgi:nitrous oxidase accessory protein